MKQLLAFAAGFGVGYIVVTKLAPILQAKIEAVDLDAAWQAYADYLWEGDE